MYRPRLAGNVLFFHVFAILGPLTAQEPGPSSPTPASATPAAPTVAPRPAAIPLTEIIARAESLQREISKMTRRLPSTASLKAIQESVAQEEAAIRNRIGDTENLLDSNPTLSDVRSEQRFSAALRSWGAASIHD